jgi:hypothetical protein
MKSYKVASDEGAQRYGVEVGETVELDLEPDVEVPVIAAGWLEHIEKPKKEVK